MGRSVTLETRGRLARKHFAPGAHPAAETPFYIAAASVSARAMLNVYGHMRAPSHRPTRGNMAVLDPTYLHPLNKNSKARKARNELQAEGKAINSKAYTTATAFCKARSHNLALCKMALRTAWLCESWLYASYFSRVALRNCLGASWLCTSLLGAMCFARTAPCDFSRKWSTQATLFQAAARKLLSASCCPQVLCASCSAQVL